MNPNFTFENLVLGNSMRTSRDDHVDHEKFCVVATHGEWGVYKQRKNERTFKNSKKPAVLTACFLWNPNCRRKIDLPTIRGRFTFSKCILTASPTASECCVLFTFKKAHKFLFFRVGDNKWTYWSYVGSLVEDVIAYKGKLYVLRQRFLYEAVLGPHKPDFGRRYGDDHESLPHTCGSKVQLVDSGDELLAVLRNSIFEIYIYRMNFSKETWERVLNIGDNAILLVHCSIFLPVRQSGMMGCGNTVFFSEKLDEKFHEDQTHDIYSFRLADKCLSLLKNNADSSFCVLPDEVIPTSRLPDEPRCDSQIIIEKEESRVDKITDGDQSGSLWFQLTGDAQKLISQKLISQHLSSVFDCMNFRAVCKAWRSLVHPIRWTPNSMGVPFIYPWLMFPQQQKGMYNLYDPIANLMHRIGLPELEDCDIRFSNQGWLLVTKPPSSIFFFEPFTRTRIKLPHFWGEHWFHLDGMCFTNSPKSPNWQIFCLSHSCEDGVQIIFSLKPGDKLWSFRVIRVIDSESFPDPSYSNLVFDGQSFWYLGKNGSLNFIHKTDDLNWRIDEVVSPPCCLAGYSRQYLVCHEEELLSVFLDQMGKAVHVFKLDRKVQQWIPVKSLEQKIVYLSQTTCLVVEDVEQKKSNTIQFSMFGNVNGNGNGSNIGYSLKTKKLYRNDVQVMDLYHTKEFLSGTWIQPIVVHEMPTVV